MSLLTLILPETNKTNSNQLVNSLNDTITEHLHSLFSCLQTDKPTAYIELFQENWNGTIRLSVKPKMPQFELLKHGDALYKAVATWLATYIVDHYEQVLLNQAIMRRGFTQPDITQKVELYCQSILNHEQWDGLNRAYTEVDRKRRTNKIIHELFHFFEKEVHCSLDGILAFRLQPYKKEIKDIVDYACDEFILNQQYEEFISLLKYFVQIQECKIETVHVFQDERGFELTDEHYRPIQMNDYEDKIVVDMLETEINIDDTIISHLVAVSPKRIVLHVHPKELYETKTLRSIFADRVELCHGCHLCVRHQHEIAPIH